jgi:hypothetical protein
MMVMTRRCDRLGRSESGWSWPAAVVACGIVTAVGCGGSGVPGRPPTIATSGTLRLDGEPVSGATVTFVPPPGGHAAVAITDATGAFKLTTFQSGDGAVAGTYGVTVEKRVAAGAGGAGGGEYEPPTGPLPAPENVLPAKYASAETSGLSATVEKGQPNTVTLDLSTK